MLKIEDCFGCLKVTTRFSKSVSSSVLSSSFEISTGLGNFTACKTSSEASWISYPYLDVPDLTTLPIILSTVPVYKLLSLLIYSGFSNTIWLKPSLSLRIKKAILPIPSNVCSNPTNMTTFPTC